MVGCDSVAGWAGVSGVVAGAVGTSFFFRSITVEEKFRSLARIARLSEVIMNTAATPTVSLLRKLAGPRLPNTVWLDPPKAAPKIGRAHV